MMATTIEQSKKLAEILPIESADMYYPNRIDVKYQGALPIEFKCGNPFLSQEIPAWSLAALLDVLPDEITERYGDVYRNILFHLKGKYVIQYPRLTTLWPSLLSVEADNPIDACHEMILMLHEQNLI